MVVSVREIDRDLAATLFTKNCVAYNIIEFKHYKVKTIRNVLFLFYNVYSLNCIFVTL
jgi:hypothetical protein